VVFVNRIYAYTVFFLSFSQNELRPYVGKQSLLKRDMPDARSEKKLTAGVSMIR